MPLEIVEVRPHGLAERHGIAPHDWLVKINGEELVDEIDYQALTARSRVVLEVLNGDNQPRTVTIIKSVNAPLGLKLSNTLAPRVCKNKCMFCFIDQMPKGMRKSLYVKDDDWRLSLMTGNFVTLTNVDDKELDRIIRRKVSPLFVSVHTTNPDLRVQMLHNKDAGNIMHALRRFKDAGIAFHCQIVLCPGVNDGVELEKTLSDLVGLYPAARSAALVPVGLTRCREGLAPLKPYSKASAREILSIAQNVQDRCMQALGTRFVFPADEMYCIADMPFPEEDAYEGYPQIENGVGLLRQFEESLKEAAQTSSRTARQRSVLIACGTSIAPVMRRWMDMYAPRGVSVEVKPIVNRFFGDTVTVSGLLTGGDLISQAGHEQADEVLISATTLRAEGDLFLDDMSLADVKAQFSSKLTVVQNTGEALYAALLAEHNV